MMYNYSITELHGVNVKYAIDRNDDELIYLADNIFTAYTKLLIAIFLQK